jgi:PKD repeat protein
MSSTIVGPLYVMRNVIINPGDATFKIGTHSFGPMYIYHNTIYGDQGGAGIGHFGNDAIAENYSVLNNIFYLSGGGRCVENWYNQFTAGNNWWPIPGSAAGIVYDGNCWWTTRNEGHFAVAWLRNPNGDGSGWTHELPGSWQTALGFDIHGIVAEPLFENPVTGDFRLKAASPCADAGVIIPGINDSDSPWSYSGAAPDIGAIESGGVITHPMASFEASPMEGPVPLTVNFINHSTGMIDSYLWDFRDGHTSVEINPTHSFLAEGTYEVLLTVTGPGGQHSASRTITVFGQVINYSLTIQGATGGSTSPTAGNYSYPAGTQVPVSAIPNNGYSFDHWNLNGTDYDDNPIRVLLNNDSTLLPIFVKIPADYSVTITALAGGTTEPAPGTYEVTEGETFTVDAIPNSGYKFDHWEGDISSSQSHLSFAVSGNMNLIAVFKVLVAPPVPGFTASPSSGTAPLAVQLANQSTGNITDYYWDFGDGSPISMIVSPIHTFQSVGNYNVTLTVTGPGGSRSTSRVITVTAPPATYDLTILEAQGGSTRPVSGTYSYAENSSVDITAIPLSGYTFSHWLLNANEYTDNPLSIQMSADATLQAVFEEVVNPPEEYSLVITAMPGGITDPGPGTFSIIGGTQVVIEAIPDSGYIFDHWEGDISGVDNLTVFFMDSNKSIIAVFTQKPGTGGFALAASAAIVGVIAIAATKHKGAGR